MPRTQYTQDRLTIARRAGELLAEVSNRRYRQKTAGNEDDVYRAIREFITYRRLTDRQRRIWWANIDQEAREALRDLAPDSSED
jgi:hypothetical protein